MINQMQYYAGFKNFKIHSQNFIEFFCKSTETTGLNPGFRYTLQILNFSETSDIASFKCPSFIPTLETGLIDFLGSGCKNCECSFFAIFVY